MMEYFLTCNMHEYPSCRDGGEGKKCFRAKGCQWARNEKVGWPRKVCNRDRLIMKQFFPPQGGKHPKPEPHQCPHFGLACSGISDARMCNKEPRLCPDVKLIPAFRFLIGDWGAKDAECFVAMAELLNNPQFTLVAASEISDAQKDEHKSLRDSYEILDHLWTEYKNTQSKWEESHAYATLRRPHLNLAADDIGVALDDIAERNAPAKTRQRFKIWYNCSVDELVRVFGFIKKYKEIAEQIKLLGKVIDATKDAPIAKDATDKEIIPKTKSAKPAYNAARDKLAYNLAFDNPNLSWPEVAEEVNEKQSEHKGALFTDGGVVRKAAKRYQKKHKLPEIPEKPPGVKPAG